ncbi:MAG: hypothetical protein WCG31_04330 [Deltaproteobacteria bacterium]
MPNVPPQYNYARDQHAIAAGGTRPGTAPLIRQIAWICVPGSGRVKPIGAGR